MVSEKCRDFTGNIASGQPASQGIIGFIADLFGWGKPRRGCRSLFSSRQPAVNLNNSRGVALLTVLLVTALMTVLVLSMTWDRQLELRRTANLVESDQALLLTLGLEEWAGRIMMRDLKMNTLDHLGELWAYGLPPTPVEQGMISGNIQDLQGRFNLYNLLNNDETARTRAKDQMSRLLEMCNGDPQTVDAIIDWIDRDSDITIPGGAEDRDYLIREPPYRTANRPMASPTELLLVNGITAKTYDCLAGNVTTLPEVTTLNVNTASAKTIAALAPSDSLSLEQAEEVVKDRPKTGYAKIEDFQAQLVGTGLTDSSGLSLSSNYFLIEAKAIFGHSEVTLFSVIQRTTNGIKIISRSIGTY